MLPSDGKEGQSASCDSISFRFCFLTATGTEICVIGFAEHTLGCPSIGIRLRNLNEIVNREIAKHAKGKVTGLKASFAFWPFSLSRISQFNGFESSLKPRQFLPITVLFGDKSHGCIEISQVHGN